MYLNLHHSFIYLICAISFALPLSTESSSLPATYDYIVIGGGTAGLALASRLSENPNIHVAVVEAGGHYEIDSGNKSVIPGYAAYGTLTDPATANATPSIDWGFVTAPVEGLNGRAFHYARGKTLGGSSARNYMVYVPLKNSTNISERPCTDWSTQAITAVPCKAMIDGHMLWETPPIRLPAFCHSSGRACNTLHLIPLSALRMQVYQALSRKLMRHLGVRKCPISNLRIQMGVACGCELPQEDNSTSTKFTQTFLCP